MSMRTDWINILTIDYIGNVKMMTVEGKSFRQRASGEYETSSLCTPYILVSLLLNKNFGRYDGIFSNIGWIPLMYHVTMEGTMFNWADIIANRIFPCV